MSDTSSAAPNKLPIEEQMLLTTARITASLPTGLSHGTGFYYRIAVGDAGSITLLITNKHVLRGHLSVTLRMRRLNGELSALSPGFDVTLPAGAFVVFEHPNADVDLAAIFVPPFVLKAREMGHEAHPVWLLPEHLPTSEFASDMLAIENVVMVGYPIGLLDEVNNLPIVRSGITATPYIGDYNGRQEFVVDMACFPGSSGSPVFYAQSGVVRTRKGTNLGASRFALIGILYAGPYWTAEGKLETRPAPTATATVPVVNQMINLGYCIKAGRLRELEELARSEINAVLVSGEAQT